MSAGTPTPGRFSLDDAVDELRKLVDAAELQNDLTRATNHILLTGGAPAGAGSGTGGGSGGLGDLFKKYFGGRGGDSAPSPARGLGGFLKHRFKTSLSRPKRWRWAGKRIGAGLGRSLGMGAEGAAGLGRAGAALGAAAGAAASVVAVVAVVVVALQKFYSAVDSATEEQMAVAKRLSEVSGSMAAVVANREVGQIFRDLRRGEGTAGSASALQQAESRRKDQENRLEIVFDNAKNSVLAVLNDMLATVFRPVADIIEKIADKLGVAAPAPAASGLAAGEAAAMAAVARLEATSDRLLADARRAARVGSPEFGRVPPGGLP